MLTSRETVLDREQLCLTGAAASAAAAAAGACCRWWCATVTSIPTPSSRRSRSATKHLKTHTRLVESTGI
jgi:hypothetical protein